MRFIVSFLAFLGPVVCFGQASSPTSILYNQVLSENRDYPELLGTNLTYTDDGLHLRENDQLVKLNKYFALGRRLIRYHVRLSADAEMVFSSNEGDFSAQVDMGSKRIGIATTPALYKQVDFLDASHEYLVEIHRDYQTSGIRIVDLFTGQSAELFATMDGGGGVGRGMVQSGFYVGLQHDYYCFGLKKGSDAWVKQLIVESKETDLTLLIYGDSITEPEGYFPTEDFHQSWTQLIINRVQGKAMSSGRGGTTIHQLLDRIKNELPYIKAKYVMVTIGTNGGNTEENLSELVAYIKSQGAIPILNNIPANESNTHIDANVMIEKIRQKYGIKGCRFDLATSADHDGKDVDQTTMYFEDYDWGKIYHHPNVKGSKLMFLRTLIDVPEIYK
ncbi:SGNH/GDSL hydrolase family protein [Parapedobacter sp. 10938]|uniref:SGNH/GDSL hydrolase family protein n=1 Tax=Parapedobacter flavus TaxID=3110225 RepID=UPI002DBECBBC|nr:SGNH/GDSL hydrolase family protein [Parapedobacter sp. 10938]MEC3881653.1 SGNH/GDSL hydrolase family protein [Parapedobacter sp. 10938]